MRALLVDVSTRSCTYIREDAIDVERKPGIQVPAEGAGRFAGLPRV